MTRLIPRLEAFDIDTEEDFEIAQLYIKYYFQEIRHNVKGSSFIS
jgi:CMP-N-acetylneuraminic acid synthetase